MKIVGYIAIFFGGMIVSYLMFQFSINSRNYGILGYQQEPMLLLPTYLSFISVMMTAVTAVLAAVAIGIGIIAAYTFREIKDESLKLASNRVNDLVSEKLSDEAIGLR
jgi:hypothetical protein